MNRAGERLEIAASLLAAIRAHAEACYPEECCGLLVGQGLAEGTGWRVTRWLPAANIHPQPRRHFELDPAAHIALLRQLRESEQAGEGGETLLGHLHSHPDAAAKPSARDRAQAFDPQMLWLIIAVPEGHAGPITAWRAPNAQREMPDFRQIPLFPVEDGGPGENNP